MILPFLYVKVLNESNHLMRRQIPREYLRWITKLRKLACYRTLVKKYLLGKRSVEDGLGSLLLTLISPPVCISPNRPRFHHYWGVFSPSPFVFLPGLSTPGAHWHVHSLLSQARHRSGSCRQTSRERREEKRVLSDELLQTRSPSSRLSEAPARRSVHPLKQPTDCKFLVNHTTSLDVRLSLERNSSSAA